MAVRVRLLGDVEVRLDGQVVDIGHARQRCVLAALLVEANRVVPADQLLDRVWADRPPQRARNALSAYVSRLRQVLSVTDETAIARWQSGYLLTVDPMAVDMHQFRHLIAEARAGNGDDATSLFERALGLWDGEAFAALDTPWLNAVRNALAAERLAAELDRNDLALANGQHAARLDELAARATAYPLDERLAGQLMLALYRCGRQADALHRYERLRLGLAEELGADPSPPLRRLHQQILTADPALAPTTSPAHPVPRQLPAPPPSFAGRARELAALADLPTVVVISGTAGVGKTALAVCWAHQVADRFPDGQLYLNLRGFDPSGSVVEPAEAIRGFLDALGGSPPSDSGERGRAGRAVSNPAGGSPRAGTARQRPGRRAGAPAASGPGRRRAAVASLAGVTLETARRLLAELARAHLVAEHTPGRYAFHDLLRAYATELAYAHDSEPQRAAALHRLFDHYLHTAHTAALLLDPYRDEVVLAERLPDGGWNCEAENGSVRSSFDTTINVLEGLVEFERATGGSDAVREARRSGEEYLLVRDLFRRRSTGEAANPEYLDVAFPYYWHYDVLRALDYFRQRGAEPDPRMADAVEAVRAKRQPDGRWPLDRVHPGSVHFALEGGAGEPSRWNTLRALRVLAWWEGRAA